MIRKRVRCLNKPQARSSRTWAFVPMRVSQARQLDVDDPVSVVVNGQRCVGNVRAVYRGKGAFTRLRVAYNTGTGAIVVEDFYNDGWMMRSVIVPQPGKVIMFFPESKNGQLYRRGIPVSVQRATPLDF